ncbi:MAG: glucosaminidase domain-containing protein [Candidatus Amulumruptor caecigallinarius]|nr:glucosaminidase domain-containing protein [Candidatus Amulumruptor caecigallinarius]
MTHYINQFICLLFIFSISFPLILRADAYSSYIETYAPIAIEQQSAYGIPASITLAQGLLESAAGRSTLATRGNNHFGIKCHNEWTGDTLLRSDDAPNECFRAYATPEESFLDHSRFLLRKRYSSLFLLDPLDYAAWANGLKSCGYATDPNYATRLITIIERYALYTYDSHNADERDDAADFILSSLRSTHPVRRFRGLHYVIAAPNDTYESIAKEFNIKPKNLLSYNDRSRNGIVKDWQEVYLEPKHESAPQGVLNVTIGEGESFHSVSQRYGMKLKTIEQLNKDVPDSPGSVIKLR